MFQGLFRSFNGGELNFDIFIEDLPRDKLIACSDLWACAKVHTVRVAEMAFFARFFLPRCSFRISLSENQEKQLRFKFVYLR